MTERTKMPSSPQNLPLRALRSRRGLVALAVLLVGLLTLLIPEQHAVHDEFVIVIMTLALMLIGGFYINESARSAKEQNGHDEERLRLVIEEPIGELIEEMMAEQAAQNDSQKERANV